uniref:Uncharacterized protein n=1 Tax=Cacopsylla melanoneura TaxID=428564 RepID=A0A8D8R7J0_9HEMI
MEFTSDLSCSTLAVISGLSFSSMSKINTFFALCSLSFISFIIVSMSLLSSFISHCLFVFISVISSRIDFNVSFSTLIWVFMAFITSNKSRYILSSGFSFDAQHSTHSYLKRFFLRTLDSAIDTSAHVKHQLFWHLLQVTKSDRKQNQSEYTFTIK